MFCSIFIYSSYIYTNSYTSAEISQDPTIIHIDHLQLHRLFSDWNMSDNYLLPREPQSSDWPFLRIIWYVRLYLSSDFADVESLSQDSCDEEDDEEREEVKPKAEVTSMDEALRTVTDSAVRSREDFLKQNFETLAESCSTGQTGQTHTRANTDTHSFD